MSVSYFVVYRGKAEDPEAFINRYRDVHIPILASWPDVERIVLHTPVPARDPKKVIDSGFAMMAEIVFPILETLSRALQSKERDAARQDFQKFPPFDGIVLHQAMQRQEFTPQKK